MKIKKITLYHIQMKLITPFITSIGHVEDRELILVEVEDVNGVIGWGEVVAFSSPWYTEETVKTAWHMLEDFLIPIVLNQEIDHPTCVAELFSNLKRNNMAKSGLEGAIWDLYAKQRNLPLARVIGGVYDKIESGVVVSLTTVEETLQKLADRIEEGYKRIKIKIKPGQDYELLKTIRHHFPDIPIMADANSAYSLDDLDHLKKFDEFDLMMIEQPLHSDDIIDHAKLQKELKTSICLDESITSFEDAKKAIELGSCRVINIKIGRVGGLTEAKKIHDYCNDHHIPVWCGGMLETGISRAHNIALASLPNFTIPGDISASSRYWEKDIIIPEVTVQNGYIEVPTGPGIGFEVNRELVNKFTLKKNVFYCK